MLPIVSVPQAQMSLSVDVYSHKNQAGHTEIPGWRTDSHPAWR